MTPPVRPEPDTSGLAALIAARRQALAAEQAPKPPSTVAASDATAADLPSLIAERRRALGVPQFSPGQQFGTEVVQGLTLHTAPKIAGALNAAGQFLTGHPERMGSAYTAARDRVIAMDEDARTFHPYASFFTQAAAGVGGPAALSPFTAPAKAAAEAPSVLSSLVRGAATGAKTGATVGAITGFGDATGGVGDYASRITRGAAAGAFMGGTVGATTAGTASLLRHTASGVADNLNPMRPAVRNAAMLIDDGTVANMDAINKEAPGGASLVNAAVPPIGKKVSRLLKMVRGVGADPVAAQAAENNFLAQGNALETARRGLSDQMSQIQGRVPTTSKLKASVELARDIISKHVPDELPAVDPTVEPAKTVTAPAVTTAQTQAPDLRTAVSNFWDRAAVGADRALRPSTMTTEQQQALTALERHGAEAEAGPRYGTPPGERTLEIAPERVTDPGQPPGYDIQDLHDALSRLRYIKETMQRNPNPNGPQLGDVKRAISGIKNALYQTSPEYAALDRRYSIVKGAAKQTTLALNAVQDSRASYGAVGAYNTEAGSIGAHLPSNMHAATGTILKALVGDRAASADAISRLITTPGDGNAAQQVMDAANPPPRVQIPANWRVVRAITNARMAPGMVGGTIGGETNDAVLRRLLPSLTATR